MSVILLLACSGSTVSYSGTSMLPYFPFDGDRDATYVNGDETLGYDLVVSKASLENVDGRDVATFEYSKDDGTLLYSVQWSTRSGQPVQINGYAEGTGDWTVYDPPIDVVDATMHSDSSVTTETGGRTWTGTYFGPADCPVLWGGLEWDGCAHIRIDDGDGDDMTGPAFSGEYWLVTRYGAAWMHPSGFGERWTLSDYDWDTGG